MAWSAGWCGVCHGARFGEGPVLASLAMLALKGALRVAPGGSAPLFPFAARHGLWFPRSGRESRLADRTGKLFGRDRRLNDRVFLWIEGHRANRRPVAGFAAPASWVGRACPQVKFVTARQQPAVFPGMALCRTDVTDPAVAMIVVVSTDKTHGPIPCRIEIGETLGRELRPVFGGAEQRLGVRVKVDPIGWTGIGVT